MPIISRISNARWLVLAAAVCGLVINDHLLKGAGVLPGWVTGKLSDVFGLVAAPAVLVLALGLRRTGARVASHLAVAGVFAAMKLSPAFAGLLERLTSAAGWPWTIWLDPTDLLTLPALGIAWWLTRPSLSTAMPPRAWRLVVLGGGALACAASSVDDRHHAAAYLVNRTGAVLNVERAYLGSRGNYCSTRLSLEELEAIPDGWFRDADFGDAVLFAVQPGGVLPLQSNCAARLTIGQQRRLVFVDPSLTSRPLPNVPEAKELQNPTGLLFVEGNQAEPQFRAGPRLALRSISPDWAPVPPPTCAEAAVPPLEFGPLPSRGSARITGKRSLGGGCFAVQIERAPDDDAGVPDAGADVADGGTDGGPPLSASQLLRFCMPEALFPFQVGARLNIGPDRLIGVTPGDPALRFVRNYSSGSERAVSGSAVPCGLIREACGRIWRPRHLSIDGVLLTPGKPERIGNKTYYLARSGEDLVTGRNCTPAYGLEYLEVENARL